MFEIKRNIFISFFFFILYVCKANLFEYRGVDYDYKPLLSRVYDAITHNVCGEARDKVSSLIRINLSRLFVMEMKFYKGTYFLRNVSE